MSVPNAVVPVYMENVMPELGSSCRANAMPVTGTERRGPRQIRKWPQFARHVRASGVPLLGKLDCFPNSVLVAGCQRSGTTMLARLITQSPGMVDYRFGPDDELDAALILSGYVEHPARGRYCFQTTYLNERYREYFCHCNEHRIIWVIRNPYSVVYSLVHHWSRFAFTELFDACGVQLLSETEQQRYRRYGNWGISRLRRACLCYQGKTSQLFEIVERMGKDRIMVVDYDELVRDKARMLPAIYRFIELPYKPEYGVAIGAHSLNKYSKLSAGEQMRIARDCGPVYRRARALQPDPV